MTLLLKTEDLIAERRAVRVADIAAATHAALKQFDQLQAAAATPVPVDTADLQHQLLAASGAPSGGAAAGGSAPTPPAPASNRAAAATAVASASMLSPGAAAPFRFGISSSDTAVTVEGRTVSCDKATEILMRKLAEKERVIARQYRAAARQAIQGMQEDVLRGLHRHDDLRPDAFLSRLRRILPSEYLAAWAAWTGIFALLDVSNDVLFAVWALYSVLAFGYVFMRLLQDRAAKDARDDTRLLRGLPAAAAAAAGPAAAGPTAERAPGGDLRAATVKADMMGTVASGVDAVSISRFSELPDDELHTESIEIGSASAGASPGDAEVDAGRRLRGGAAPRSRAQMTPRPPQRRTPGNVQLFMQALVSAVAFLLLSAFAAGIHTAIGAPVWVFFVPVVPFVLFAQFVLPDGLVSR